MAPWATLLLAMSVLSPGTTPLPRERIMALPPELEAVVHERILIGRGQSREQRLAAVADYVYGEHGLALTYDGERTLTVAEVAEERTANCLSFTLLFVALAREAGLNAYAQEVEQVLAWYQQDGFVYNSGHVNVGVQIGRTRYTFEADRVPMIARHRPVPISDDRALAHYYNNRGAELMAEGDVTGARAHLDAALDLDAGYVPAWNNLGVLLARNEQPAAAEEAYLKALSLAPDHSAALFNVVGFYQRAGDTERHEHYRERLREAQLADPFHQFLLAHGLEMQGDFTGAIGHYRRAIRLHPDEHLFHFGLARVYFLAGEHRRAARAMARAHSLAEGEARSLYQAKLQELRR